MACLHRNLIGVLLLGFAIGCGGDSASESAAPRDAGMMNMDMDSADIGQEVDAEPTIPEPNLEVMPTGLVLPGTPGMASEPQMIVLRNTGTAALVISEMLINPQDESEHFELVDPPNLPLTIDPDSGVSFAVTYTAPDAREHNADLLIRSNDPDAQELPVRLTGRIFENCVRAVPNLLDLGSVDPGVRSGRFEFRIVNCGDTVHTITVVSLDGAPNFSWAPIGNGDVEGRRLERGDSVSIGVVYENENLAEDEVAAARITIEFGGNSAEPMIVPLTVRGGGGGERCLIRLEPDSLDFEALRIGLQRSLNIELRNRGNAPCDLREITVENTRGEPNNLFTLSQTIEPQMLAPNSTNTLEVTYSPQVDNPVGEQGILRVQYFDQFQNMNRAEEALLIGVGAEAQAGAIPESLYFDEVTSVSCASRTLRIGAENVGFVPICATGYRLEGDDCDRFVLIETPDIDECLALDRGEAAAFVVQFEPNRLGEASCNILVSTDAQNTQEVALPLRGDGVETDRRTDEFEVGRLNPARDARWSLRLAAVEDSLRVFIDGERTAEFEFDAESNEIVIDPDNHPSRGAMLRIEYDTVCYDRRELQP